MTEIEDTQKSTLGTARELDPSEIQLAQQELAERHPLYNRSLRDALPQICGHSQRGFVEFVENAGGVFELKTSKAPISVKDEIKKRFGVGISNYFDMLTTLICFMAFMTLVNIPLYLEYNQEGDKVTGGSYLGLYLGMLGQATA